MVFYDSCGRYIESQTSLQARINAIEAVIDVLILQQANTIANSGADNIQEYQLNDGQTIIREVYRGSAGIAKAIAAWEAAKQVYINRLNGRVHRAVDGKNFTYYGWW